MLYEVITSIAPQKRWKSFSILPWKILPVDEAPLPTIGDLCGNGAIDDANNETCDTGGESATCVV